MIVLTETTDVMRVTLAGAVATAEPEIVACWRDITGDTYVADRRAIDTNGAGNVNFVTAPTAGSQRIVDYFSLVNRDTAPVTAHIRFVALAVNYTICIVTLQPGEAIAWAEKKGLMRLNARGAQYSVQQGGAVDVQTFATPGAATWTKPGSHVKVVAAIVFGAGGGGGGGTSGGAAAATCGGSGGGGGARNRQIFLASDLAATESLTVGTPGNGGAGGAGGADGSPGTNGTESIFKSCYAYGGGGGFNGRVPGSNTGAGGGGTGGPGGAAVSGATDDVSDITAGNQAPGPIATSASAGVSDIGVGGHGQQGALQLSPRSTIAVEYGGACSAPGVQGAAVDGGQSSVFGGGGGGAGGSTSTTAPFAGSAGGGAQIFVFPRAFASAHTSAAFTVGLSGQGGDGGVLGVPNGGAGRNGQAGSSLHGGSGGGGGGAGHPVTLGTGGAGGNGGAPGGGGGGGGSGANPGAGGEGGDGGAGLVIVASW